MSIERFNGLNLFLVANAGPTLSCEQDARDRIVGETNRIGHRLFAIYGAALEAGLGRNR